MGSQEKRKRSLTGQRAQAHPTFQIQQHMEGDPTSVRAESLTEPGIIGNRSSNDHLVRNISEEARKAIERRIEDPDISPVLIARTIGVSVRTLHRSFSNSGDSVMSFVRRRRLHKAHEDLVRFGDISKVSEIAARWLFADASHFIRNFKSTYGTPPAAYLKRRNRSPMP